MIMKIQDNTTLKKFKTNMRTYSGDTVAKILSLANISEDMHKKVILIVVQAKSEQEIIQNLKAEKLIG